MAAKAVETPEPSHAVACALSTDGRTALSWTRDTTLRVWDIDSATCKIALEGVGGEPSAISADCSTALSTSDGPRILDISTGSCAIKLRQDEVAKELGRFHFGGPIRTCALSADGGTALVGYQEGILGTWDSRSEARLSILRGHTHTIAACALSAQGDIGISASWDNSIRIWGLPTGAELARLSVSGPRAVSTDASGSIILVGDGSGDVTAYEVIAA